MLAALFMAASCKNSIKEQEASQASAKRPNILLIIGDDIGMDVTTNMYPGLIDNLTRQYGPSGHNHPKYKDIHDALLQRLFSIPLQKAV